jgi:hypothetical protein
LRILWTHSPSYDNGYCDREDGDSDVNDEAVDPVEAVDSAAANRPTQSSQIDASDNTNDPSNNPGNEFQVRDVPAPERRRRYFENSPEGFLKAWSKVVYADDRYVLRRAWDLLCTEFPSQTCKFYWSF